MRVEPRIVVATGVVFTSFSSVFIRLSHAPAAAIAANPMILATLMLVPIVLHERFSAARDTPRPVLGAKVVLLCTASGAFLALHFAAWIRSLELTTIASATVIVNSQPLFVVSAGYLLFGERISRPALLFMLITISGGVLLSAGDVSLGGAALTGDLFALLGAVTLAGYMMIGRYLRRSVGARIYVFLVYGSSAVFLTILCLAGGTPIGPYPPREYLLFASMAFFCTILGHTFFNWALKYLTTSYISTIILGEPIFATLLGLIIFSEAPPPLTIAGGAVMLFGLVAFVREERNVQSEGGFDEKAKHWDDNPAHRARNRAIAAAIRRLVPLRKTMRALDYGAGTGALSTELADDLGEIVAVDTSAGMLEVLKEKIAAGAFGAAITSLRHDLSESPLDAGEFDLAYTAMTLHHVEDVDLLVVRLFDLLRPGGYVAIADLELENGDFHGPTAGVHHHGFEPERVKTLAGRAGFVNVRVERVFEIERDGGRDRFGVFLLVGEKP